MDGVVTAVHRSACHSFTKGTVDEIVLLAGLGVEGDAHCGATVQHRSRVAVDPSRPNLRQVHLLAAELHDELRRLGFGAGPGDLGENVTTRGVPLLDLPTGTLLRLGSEARVALTGLRNPCGQIDRHEPGVLAAVLGRDDGGVVRRAGVMAVVVRSSPVRPGDPVRVRLAPEPHQPLGLV
jgi:MOSC domain-containing protein YiiM